MRILLSYIVVFHSLLSHSQPALKIGDKVPAEVFQALSTSAEADVKKPVVMLEFWSTSCGSCIKALPKLNALQKKFRDSVQMVLISSDSEEKVRQLLKRLPEFKPEMPMMNADQILSRYFPYNTVPHLVVIYRQRVRFIPYQHLLTDSFLRAVIDGNNPVIRNREPALDFDISQSLFSEGNGRLLNELKSYSILLGNIPQKSGGGTGFFRDSLRIGYRFYNTTLIELYKFAYGENSKTDFTNRSVLKGKARSKLTPPADPWNLDRWLNQNTYCYEIAVALEDSSSIFEYMRADLGIRFPYKVSTATRETLALTITSAPLKSKAANLNKKGKVGIYGDRIVFENVKPSIIARELNRKFDARIPPVLDETKMDGTCSLSVSLSDLNLADVKRQLQAFGIDLLIKSSPVKMLLIEEKGCSDMLHPSQKFTVLE